MKIKICGLTREEDAVFAAEHGADFLGMIFVAASPRCIDVARASSIARAVVGSRSKLVGVFRDSPSAEICDIVQRVGLDLVQLHGSETDADIVDIGVPVIKTLTVGDTPPDATSHPHAEWILFDSGGGGTGRRFDWSLLATYERKQPFLLAGGITPDNVAAAISVVRPDAIDVASGVESSPGVKDHAKIEKLIRRVVATARRRDGEDL
jgi:phosphoribosylanthranilate isomerase